jgi:hypothetical protein
VELDEEVYPDFFEGLLNKSPKRKFWAFLCF